MQPQPSQPSCSDPPEPKRCQKCGNHHQSICASNVTTFYWPHGGREVFLVGDWSKWQCRQPMQKVSGVFSHDLNLKIGLYHYKFIVDGNWCYDEGQLHQSDHYGSYNNVIQVLPRTVYLPSNDIQQDHTITKQKVIKITTRLVGSDVRILGNWDDWKTQRKMTKKHNPLKNCDESFIELVLEYGKAYEYKFKINGDYLIDETAPTIQNGFGSMNNRLIVRWHNISDSPKANEHHNCQVEKEIQAKGIGKYIVVWTWRRIEVEEFRDCIFGHSMCSVGDEIYIFGGKRRGTFTSDLIRLRTKDLQQVQIQRIAIQPRAFHSALVYGNKLLIYGGCGPSQILSDYHVFVTQTNLWIESRIKGTPPHKRQKGSCVLFRQLLVFFGGYYCSPDIEMQTFFNDLAVLDIESMVWATQPKLQGGLPCARFSHSANLYGSQMYIFGGEYCTDRNVNDVWRIDLDRKGNALKWEQMKPAGSPPCPRHGHSANIIQHFLVIFGGMGDGDRGQILNDIKILDLKNLQWIHPQIKGDIPKPRHYHASATVQHQQIIMFGGRTTTHKNQNIYVLKPAELTEVLSFDQESQ